MHTDDAVKDVAAICVISEEEEQPHTHLIREKCPRVGGTSLNA